MSSYPEIQMAVEKLRNADLNRKVGDLGEARKSTDEALQLARSRLPEGETLAGIAVKILETLDGEIANR
jgi:hypothetical protein